MKAKKIAHKAMVGGRILRNEGALTFTIKSLQKVQSKVGRKSNQKHSIFIKAKIEDTLLADYTVKRPAWKGTKAKKLTFNWLMPPPGKGSGGHMTLFRFIKALENAGHECRIYLYAQDGKGPVDNILAAMGDSFPKLRAIDTMQWLEHRDDMLPADGIFATSWETAYPVFNAKLDAKRFYFVQDFEPYFYPHGSFYSLAENTYKFNLFGVTAGGWLASKLKKEYGMQTAHFDFAADHNVYKYENKSERKEVLVYVRPFTERRGFEMAILSLMRFHQLHPDYTINFLGWDISDYKIPFPHVNHKTLEVDELNKLYNKCAAGLVLSFTNMSLLPLELLASGTIPVVNSGDNNAMVSDNSYIAYAEANPVALADALSHAVTRKDVVKHAQNAAKSVRGTSWEESGLNVVKIIEEQTRKHE